MQEYEKLIVNDVLTELEEYIELSYPDRPEVIEIIWTGYLTNNESIGWLEYVSSILKSGNELYVVKDPYSDRENGVGFKTGRIVDNKFIELQFADGKESFYENHIEKLF